MAKKEKAKTQPVQRYSRREFIANAAAFGVKPEVMAGALYGVETASKAEAEKRLKDFLSRGVK